MKLRTLGTIDLEGASFSERQPLLLLAYVALTGRTLRSELADVFWMHKEKRESRLDALSEALRKLKKVSASLLEINNTRIHAHVSTDIEDFEKAYREEDFETVVQLYQGPFLSGIERTQRLNLSEELNEWIINQRETLHAKALESFLVLAARQARLGQFAEAGALAWKAFSLDKTVRISYPDPEAYSQMHLLLLAAGRSVDAEAIKCEAEDVYEVDELSFVESEEEARKHLTLHLPEVSPFFTGRNDELGTLNKLLTSSVRLVTLTGVAGVGKTELAKALARSLRAGFKDGVYFVLLESLPPGSDEASILRAIAQTMGFSLETRDPLDSLINRIGDKKILLLLDNFEPLVSHASVLARLLEACPKLSLLVTSRIVLNLRFEHVLELSGLGFDSPSTITQLAELTEASDSAKLLTKLAQQQSIALADSDVPALRKLGELVAGLPLALKLVSGWLSVRTLDDIIRQVENNLGVFNQARTDDPQRHHSVRAAFDVSHALLSKEEQAAFRNLAVFASDFTAEATASIATCDLLLLKQLVTKSLLYFNRETERFSFHPLVRQYARGKLFEFPEEEKELRDKHSHYFLARVRMMTDAEQEVKNQAPKLLGPEAEDIFGAWRWAVRQGYIEKISSTALSLMLFAYVSTNMTKAESLFEEALQIANSNELQGKLLSNLAWCKLKSAKYTQAIETASKGLSYLQKSQDLISKGNCLLALGSVNEELGYFEEAYSYKMRELSLHPEDSVESANAKTNLILILLHLGRHRKINQYIKSAGAIFKKHNKKERLVWLACQEAHFYLDTLNYMRAQSVLERVLIEAASDQLTHWVLYSRLMLAKVYLAMKDFDKANKICTDIYQWDRNSISVWDEILLLTIQGRIELEHENYYEARQCFGYSLMKTYKIGNAPGLLYRLILFFDLYLRTGKLEMAAKLQGFLTFSENSKRTSFVDRKLLHDLANPYQVMLDKYKNMQNTWRILSLEEVTSIILNECGDINRLVALTATSPRCN